MCLSLSLSLTCQAYAAAVCCNIYCYCRWKYCTDPSPYRSVMANACSGVAVSRVPYFSSPLIVYQDKTTGTATADNARVLRETRLVVSNFLITDASVTAPPTPGPTAAGTTSGTTSGTTVGTTVGTTTGTPSQPGEATSAVVVVALVVIGCACSKRVCDH
jgi:hypothetical protein